MSTLHVTNGDAVGAGLIEAGFGDAVLPWRDVLHDGPVPSGLGAEALRIVRAKFLSGRGWTSFDIALADQTGRDAQLAAMGPHDHVVLWFEPDLHDQLQLLQILARLYLRPMTERPDIAIIATDELLGPLPVKKLAAYADTQRAVRGVDLELAATGWEAFTNVDSRVLQQFAGTDADPIDAPASYQSDPTVILPHMRPALRRLLQEYPSDSNGLSRTEQQMLEVLGSGSHTVESVYRAAHAPREDMAWLADWPFAWYVERLMMAHRPLIAFSDGATPNAGLSLAEADRFWHAPIQLTVAGQAVLNNELNAIALNGIDRWIGGVHLLAPRRS